MREWGPNEFQELLRLYHEHLDTFCAYLELRALEEPPPDLGTRFPQRVMNLWTTYAETIDLALDATAVRQLALWFMGEWRSGAVLALPLAVLRLFSGPSS